MNADKLITAVWGTIDGGGGGLGARKVRSEGASRGGQATRALTFDLTRMHY